MPDSEGETKLNIEITAWQALSLLLTFFGCVAGMGKVLLAQAQRHMDMRFAAQEAERRANHEATQMRLNEMEASARSKAGEWQRLEREMLELKAELPQSYVRREDYIRGQSVIEAKLDALAVKLENVQLRQIPGGGTHGNS